MTSRTAGRPRVHGDELRAAALELSGDGLSIRAIAAKLGVSKSTVARRLAALNPNLKYPK